jgi:hypothetical protein
MAEESPIPAATVTLTYFVEPANRREFLEFLAEAFPFYEAPGGIRMSLFESADEPGLFHEVASYETIQAYASDQMRVEKDQAMKAMLASFRTYVSGPLDVKRLLRVDLPRV